MQRVFRGEPSGKSGIAQQSGVTRILRPSEADITTENYAINSANPTANPNMALHPSRHPGIFASVIFWALTEGNRWIFRGTPKNSTNLVVKKFFEFF